MNLETIDEETVFFQLQSVFAHLMESRLQYFVPDRWDSRSLDPEILHTVPTDPDTEFMCYDF